ncbi:GNAT family N-acetyltransferase [Streptomyces sp. NPDC057781]|uniref:GNAT family N-acetyltransferase n=1 Tax=unclassified Streptomyces TaxID=2593676 RepID=UPI0036B44F61
MDFFNELAAHDTRDAEVGFWLAVYARGTGVMTEAVQAMCHWGFSSEGMGLHRILGMLSSGMSAPSG